MLKLWIVFFIELLIMALFKSIIANAEDLAVIFVLLHVFVSIIIIFSFPKKYTLIYLFAFLIRFLALLWDLNMTHIFVLPNSGADSEMFYNQALTVSNNLSLWNEFLNGGIYSKLMGTLFYFVGASRILGQYINVLLGFSTILVIHKTMNLLNLNKKTKYIVVILASFFPNSIVMSAIFLREIIPTFFVAASVYYFVKWYKQNKLGNIISSFILLFLASAFHSGVIAISIGYIFGFIFYNKKENRLRFSRYSILSFIIILLFLISTFTLFDDYIFGKFKSIDEISDIYNTANRRLGGSAYLVGLTMNNPIQFALFTPLKGFYFIASPLPFDWRGFMDSFTFFSDSLLYLVILFFMFKNYKNLKNNKNLMLFLVIALISSIIIFGIGVGNAGTAVRHRQKLVPLFLILFSISYTRFKVKKNHVELIR